MTKEKSSRARALSAKQAQKLIQSSGWSIDNDLNARVPESIYYVAAVYSHLDGQVLVVLNDGVGRLYNSREDWLSLLASVEETIRNPRRPVHFLDGRLPQGRDFARIAPSLVEQLARELDIPLEQLDGSRASLELVDQMIHQKEPDESLASEIFAPLVAYIGEVVKSSTDLEWEMRLGSDETTWEPWLVSSSRSFPIASMVYNELYEEPDYSISAIADVCL